MMLKLRPFFFFLITTLLLSTAVVSAQTSARLTLSGTVRNAKTGEPVPGVAVFIASLSKGVVADAEGKYTITALPAGKHTVTFSLISYGVVVKDVDLTRNVTGFDVEIEEQSIMLGRSTVVGRRTSDTEVAMVSTVKAATQVVSGVSAAQISKSPDRNASEVVRRVPGITVMEDRFVVIRGLSQRYNNAWINGLAVPSTETDSRAFSFDLIPSGYIDNLVVFKSPSPEIPGDFSGGFVKITTKGVPDENATEIGYQTGFNFRTQFNDFLINPGSGTDFLGFDASKRPLGKSFPAHMNNITDPDEITRLTRGGFNNDWGIKNITPLPDQRITFMLARRIETKNEKTIGNITAINYSNTFKAIENMKNARYGLYSPGEDKSVYFNDYTDNQYSNDVRLGVMHNWSLKLNTKTTLEFKNLLNIVGRNRLTTREGIDATGSSPLYQTQTEMLYSSRLTYTGQFSGMHYFSGSHTIGWDLGYSYANKNEPDRRIIDNSDGLTAGVSRLENVPNKSIKRYFQDLDDNIFSTSINYRNRLNVMGMEPTFKAGVYGEYYTRDYIPRTFVYNRDNIYYTELPGYLALPVDQMLSADKVFIQETTERTNSYWADVMHGAGYLMFEIPLGKLSLYAGARAEQHTVKMKQDHSMSSAVQMMKTVTTEELNILPSVNFTYNFNDKHLVRAAYGRSVNRPELRELSSTVYYDFDLFGEIMGNPDLKTALIDNLDLRYEFYPSEGETISIGAFYKQFKNPIEWTYIDIGSATGLRYMHQNADKATSWGFELEARKSLDFVGAPNMAVVLNAAWIESNVKFKPGEVVTEPDRPMQGQSPYIINAGLHYGSEKLGLNAALLYNRVGKRIVGLGKSNSSNNDLNSLIPDSYEMPRNMVDVSLSKKLSKRVELRFAMKDILSEDVTFKQFPKFEKDGVIHEREQTTKKYNPGQSFTVGVSVKL